MFSEFLADRPVLKDRLFACAVFSGIAAGGVSGFNMIITGGFDFLTPGREVRQAAPSAFETVVPATWFEQAQIIPMASTEPLFAGETTPVSEQLDGGAGAVAADDRESASDDASGDELYQQLAARYDAPQAQETQDAAPAFEVTPPDDGALVAEPDENARFDVMENQTQEALPAGVLPDKPPA